VGKTEQGRRQEELEEKILRGLSFVRLRSLKHGLLQLQLRAERRIGSLSRWLTGDVPVAVVDGKH